MTVGMYEEELYPVYVLQSEEEKAEGWIPERLADIPSPIIERHRKAMKEFREVNKLLKDYYADGSRP